MSNFTSTVVLITSVGGAAGIACIKSLRKQTEFSLRLIGVDCEQYAAGFFLCDSHFEVPRATSPEYIPYLLDICSTEKVALLIPIHSQEVPVIAQNIHLFHALNVKVTIPSFETIDLFDNKLRAYEFFIKNNISTPITVMADSLLDKEILPFPIYIKPMKGSGQKYHHIVDNAGQLQSLISKPGVSYIAQPIISSAEYTVDILSDSDSQILAAVNRERVKVRDGKTYVGKTAANQEILGLVSKIALEAHLVGPWNLQYFWSPGQPPVVFELNTRFAAGGLLLATESGANIPLMLVKQSLAIKQDPVIEYQVGLVMIRYLDQVFVKETQTRL